MIGDRVGVQLVPKKEAAQALCGDRRRDTEAFEASDEQYAAVGLEVNARKKVRRALVFEAWGGQIEGDTGWNGPPRRKLLALMWVTAELAELGVTELLLLWASFLQFRRAMTAFTDRLGASVGRGGRVLPVVPRAQRAAQVGDVGHVLDLQPARLCRAAPLRHRRLALGAWRM